MVEGNTPGLIPAGRKDWIGNKFERMYFLMDNMDLAQITGIINGNEDSENFVLGPHTDIHLDHYNIWQDYEYC